MWFPDPESTSQSLRLIGRSRFVVYFETVAVRPYSQSFFDWFSMILRQISGLPLHQEGGFFDIQQQSLVAWFLLQTLHFSVLIVDGLFLVDSLDLVETPFKLEFEDLAYLFYFELFLLLSLVVKLTSLMSLLCGRFIADFPSLALVELILQSRSSY